MPIELHRDLHANCPIKFDKGTTPGACKAHTAVLASGLTLEGRGMNRRVDVVVLIGLPPSVPRNPLSQVP